MTLTYTRKLHLSLGIQAFLVSWIYCKDLTRAIIPLEDVLLLKDEADPKCFTRTEEDFTCFFETTDERTYDLYYNTGKLSRKKKCPMSTQRTTEGTFLHICSFPYLDVVTYVDTHIQVVEHNTNNSICIRTVSVEDHILLDAPFNVYLHQNDKAGQLQVSWLTKVPKYWEDKVKYRIRYSSKRGGEKTKEGTDGWDDTVVLAPLIPGEEVQVQVAVKCANSDTAGHWSHWSDSVREMVPQHADDISLKCYTSDLQTITCHWNASRYSQPTLFYKMNLSESLGWTDWTECLPDRKLTDHCSFQGDKSRKVKVKLNSASGKPSRTFYTQAFTIQNIIKTSPPAHLRGSLAKDRLCLKWDAPRLTLSAHLQYEVGCQIRESKAWLHPPVTAKQYFEEAASSVVEVMSQDEVSGLGKPFQESTQLLSSEQGHHGGDQEDRSPRTELKLFPDYVTLNRESVITCATGNKYVCEQFGQIRGPTTKGEGELLPKTCHCFCTEDSVCVGTCLDTDLLNHSYLPLSEPAVRVIDKVTDTRVAGNFYTNLSFS
ncbi:thrombopoietin receptor isoform X2 [Dunckerocampus dactyliophorus]|uniref:thrombopoietin receptor isoform X2 n=1 Tax=Dunckerocampus dactyliophorus TaxID=161453 RepID=UPI002405816E|nr:thrombopoietin receptor isoform X2 [Dunckerocampus dactyliophorus]